MKTSSTVVQLFQHRSRKVALRRIRAIAENLDNIAWSRTVNDLAKARQVPMSSIIKCLEVGEIDRKYFFPDHEMGIVLKLITDVAGDQIQVDLTLDRDIDKLVVMFAERIEEED